MKLGLILVYMLLVMSSVSNAGELKNISLRVDKPHNGFAKCVAENSIAQILATNPLTTGHSFRMLLNSGVVDAEMPFKTATITFLIANSDGSSKRLISSNLRSLDSKGWQLVQDSSAGIYPFSRIVFDRATVFDVTSGNETLLGPVDISNCR